MIRKKIVIISIMIIGILGFTGCTQNSSPQLPTKNTVEKIQYQMYKEGRVVNQNKVLIDSKYETFFVDSKKNVKKEVKTVNLYKTLIVNNDKQYTIYINRKLSLGTMVEYIIKDNKITHLTLQK